MDEYISKNRVKDFIHATNSTQGFTSYEDYVWLLDAVINTPAADVQPVNQWISVKDRLPNEDDCYLVVIESEICVSIDIAEYSENRWHKHDKVLYWQPLPEPPKDGETE